jgi:lipoprotein-anchoring transpeptidase ErfK/SrfK
MRDIWRPLAGIVWVVVLATGAVASVPAQAREVVQFNGASAGTIVVRSNERRLYYVLGDGRAIRYPVGVGRNGKRWSGTTMISRKYLRPDWAPPAEVKRDKPSLPDLIRGGSAENPLGAAVLILGGGKYGIHGTNKPKSIGGFVSYGCIRMYNQDIVDLYARVGVGTRVLVQ